MDDASRALKRRRIELQISQLKLDIQTGEVQILEYEAEIERRREVMAGTELQIIEMQKALEVSEDG